MDKKFIIGAAAGCAAIASIAASKKKPKQTKWDKMRKGMEEMPDDFPPRVMFDNIEAARINTEKILERLEVNESSEDDIEVIQNS
jgi:hypothetical protein